MYVAQVMRYSSSLPNQYILGVALNFDLSRSLILFASLMCDIFIICEYRIKMLLSFEQKKRPMLYNAMETYMLRYFDQCILCKVHSI